MTHRPSFQSFFIAGFECSTHFNPAGRRLDMIAATRHDEFVRADYSRMLELGISTAREGLRWHLIEPVAGHYDFSSVLPQVRAARDLGIQVIWDLIHYGYPDGLDIFDVRFVARFAGLARAFTQLLRDETGAVPFLCPLNEISFFAWAGGDTAYINPFERGRGDELKRQLVRADIAACEAIWEVSPEARIAQIDPTIHIVPRPGYPEDPAEVDAYNEAQYQGWDMLAGRLAPELGGHPKYLDLVGVNYYIKNQWVHHGGPVPRSDPRYLPFSALLERVWRRYSRPLFVAETGTEDDLRPEWLAWIGGQVREAQHRGVPVDGVCLYPILNHPGWDDDRHCHNGLWDYADDSGLRAPYAPLAAEIRRQQALFESSEENSHVLRSGVPVTPALELRVSAAATPDEPLRP